MFSYVALECAGFLSGFGYDTTVMARSKFLRSFDQQMSDMVVEYMQNHNTKFIRESIPTSIESKGINKLIVRWKNSKGEESSDEFNTVLLAVGRRAETKALNLEKAGVLADPLDGKITTVHEQTNVPHIFAIGDVVKGKPELTPVAIKAGKLLARRLYGGSSVQMDYDNVPTTVFTPLEYSSCGLTEEAAIAKYGEDNIEVYHSFFTPLEWTIPHNTREENACYAKVIYNKLDSERIVGVHLLSPNSGEIIQGFALAMKCRATKADLDQTVGVHPTVAEEIGLLNITKRSGDDPKKTGC